MINDPLSGIPQKYATHISDSQLIIEQLDQLTYTDLRSFHPYQPSDTN